MILLACLGWGLALAATYTAFELGRLLRKANEREDWYRDQWLKR